MVRSTTAELDEVGRTVKDSIAEWDFYTSIESGSRHVKMTPPTDIRALWSDNQLLLFFEMVPAEPVDLLKDKLTVANFDESFYTAFDFKNADDFPLIDMPKNCVKTFIVPDEDAAAKEWTDKMAGLGPDEAIPRRRRQLFADPRRPPGDRMRPHRMILLLASVAGALALGLLLMAEPALAKSSIGIGSGEVTPTPTSGLMGVYFAWITAFQREFFTALRHALIALRTDGAALPFLVGLSFVYGIFHAAGPGHGKAVISSYIVANRVELKRGIALSVAASIVQALTAIGVVGAGWFFCAERPSR